MVKPLPLVVSAARDQVSRTVESNSDANVNPKVGRNTGQPFSEDAGPGALLVGLRVTVDEERGPAVHSVQPIFQRAEQYLLGAWCGRGGGELQEVLARPGYAIGRLTVYENSQIMGMQAVFYRVSQQGLDLNDSYESAVLGFPSGRRHEVGEAVPVTGVCGSVDDRVRSIGLLLAEPVESSVR